MSVLKNNQGFTLMELVISIGLFALVLFVVIGQQLLFLQMRIKQQTIMEVEQQGAFVMQLMTQTIRNAQAINTPSMGSSGSLLSVDVVTLADDPTVFDVFGGQMRITKAGNLPQSLTSGLLQVSGFTIENVSYPGTSATIRIRFTLSRALAEGIPYAYEKTFYGTASVRP